MKKSTNTLSQTRRLSDINMEMMKWNQDAELARNDADVMRFHREFPNIAAKKKVHGSESLLYAATCPYFYIARVFGLAPYKFDDDQLLVSSNIKLIHSIICICLFTYIVYDALLVPRNGEPIDGFTLQITKVAKVIVNYIVVIFDLLMCFITRNEMATIWNGLQNYDEVVEELGYTRKEDKTRIWVWSTLVIATIVYIMINQTGMYAFGQPYVENVAYMIVYVATAASVMKFSGIVMLVAQRFNHLNEISLKCMSIQSRWVVGGPKVDSRMIEHLHNHLMILSENLNSVHSWSLMLWISSLCFHNVTNLFFIIEWIVEADFNLDLMTCLLWWEVSFLAQLLLLCFACHYASSKANCIGYIILGWKRQLFMRNRNMEIETSFHLMNRQLNFSAAGCFDVHLPLFRTIASSISTYLAILLQLP